MNQIKSTVAVKKSLFLLGKKKHSQGLGEQGTCAFISGEQGNKGLKMRGTGEHRSKNEGNRGPMAILGNIENQHFCFWEQGNKAIYFRGTRIYVTSLGRPKKMYVLLNLFQFDEISGNVDQCMWWYDPFMSNAFLT